MTSGATDTLHRAIGSVLPGRWGVAVSGGADSVALLRLAAGRHDLTLHVLHLNHQTRGPDSDGDAAFISGLAQALELPETCAARDVLEASLSGAAKASLPVNPSARYRELRLTLYRQAIADHRLDGVLLAHHADDQAETVMLRLLRGGGYPSLAGIRAESMVAGVRLLRPLLGVRREALRDYLRHIGQDWREDASNATGDYARNRVRQAIADRNDLAAALLEVARTCREVDDWVTTQTPPPMDVLPARTLADLPDLLAGHLAAEWLTTRGVSPGELSPQHVSALLTMCRDAASPATLNMPGNRRVVRRRGAVSMEQVDP